jgi:hypothetical protein
LEVEAGRWLVGFEVPFGYTALEGHRTRVAEAEADLVVGRTGYLMTYPLRVEVRVLEE